MFLRMGMAYKLELIGISHALWSIFILNGLFYANISMTFPHLPTPRNSSLKMEG